MKAKYHYILFTSLLFFALGFMIFLSFRDKSLYLFASEVLWILGVVYAFVVYRKIFRPIELLQQGINALKDEDFNVKFVKSGSADINELVTVYNAMIDKIRQERVQQHEQHYFLNLLIEAMPVCMIILDFDRFISSYNPQAQATLGLSDSDISKPLREISHKIGPQLESLEVGTSTLVKLDGYRYYRCTANRFMYKGFPRIFLLVEELSDELLKNEKRAYGKVIRMMSHEVNNSIGAINSIIDSLLMIEPLSEEETKEYLPIIYERNERLALFMKNFAKVIRLPKPALARVDINKILTDVAHLMKNAMDEKNIRLEINFEKEQLLAQADRSQLEQACINILKNAIEAIGTDGIIRIMTTASSITIEDDGIGISDDKKELLFTPFFSTKPTGQGVGLTLIKEILLNHGWKFSLESKEGRTQFVIEL